MSRIQELNFNVDLMKAILWQYNDALRLQSLLEQKKAWYDENQSQFWTDWVRDVFDLRTANQFGLSVWAIILGIPIVVTLEPTDPDKPTFGFGQYFKNFNRGNLARQYQGAQQLTPEQARIVLRLRYFQITTNGTAPQINRFMNYLFQDEDGQLYVIDNYDMTCFYVFTFSPSAALRFILERYDLLPRPAGVGLTYSVVVGKTWGFDQFHENFDHGNFGEE